MSDEVEKTAEAEAEVEEGTAPVGICWFPLKVKITGTGIVTPPQPKEQE